MGTTILAHMSIFRNLCMLSMAAGLLSCSGDRSEIVAYVDDEPLTREEVIFYAKNICQVPEDSLWGEKEKEYILLVAREKTLQRKLRDEGILYEDNLDAKFSKKKLQDLSFEGYKRRYKQARKDKIKYKYGPADMKLGDKYADHLHRIRVALKQAKIRQCMSDNPTIFVEEATWAFDMDTLECWFDKINIRYENN